MVWLKISALVAKYGKKYAVLVARKTCGTVSRSPEKTPCLISHKQLEISPEVLRNVHYIDTNCCRPFASLVITLLLWRSSFFIDMTVLCSFFIFFGVAVPLGSLGIISPSHHFLSLCMHPFIQEPRKQSGGSIRSSFRTTTWKSGRQSTGRTRWRSGWGWPCRSSSAW